MGKGRAPDEGVARDFTLCVRLTPEQKKAVDNARGATSRSDFVREAITRASRRPGGAG